MQGRHLNTMSPLEIGTLVCKVNYWQVALRINTDETIHCPLIENIHLKENSDHVCSDSYPHQLAHHWNTATAFAFLGCGCVWGRVAIILHLLAPGSKCSVSKFHRKLHAVIFCCIHLLAIPTIAASVIACFTFVAITAFHFRGRQVKELKNPIFKNMNRIMKKV